MEFAALLKRKPVWTLNGIKSQEFNLPPKLMLYYMKNPATSSGYMKTIKTCKWFYAKNPINIIDRLSCIYFEDIESDDDSDSDDSSSDGSSTTEYSDYGSRRSSFSSDEDIQNVQENDNNVENENGSPLHPSADDGDPETDTSSLGGSITTTPKPLFKIATKVIASKPWKLTTTSFCDLEENFWIKDSIHLNDFYATDVADLLKKVYRSDATLVDIVSCKINFEDFKTLTPVVEDLRIVNSCIRNAEYDVVSFADVVKTLTSITKIKFDFAGSGYVMGSADFFDELIQISHIRNIETLSLFNIPVFVKVDKLLKFLLLKVNKNCQTILHFGKYDGMHKIQVTKKMDALCEELKFLNLHNLQFTYCNGVEWVTLEGKRTTYAPI